MGCCQGCARWVIGIVSACVIICAVVAAVIVYKQEKDRDWSEFVKNNSPFIFILVTMAFAVVSSIIGFVLCCCKKKCLYVTYLIIIIIVILVEIAAIVLAFVFKDKMLDGIEENWPKSENTEDRLKIEKEHQCCGFKAPDVFPVVCGYEKPIGAPVCFDVVKKELEKNFKGLKIAVIVMAVIEIVLFICSVYLVCTADEDD